MTSLDIVERAELREKLQAYAGHIEYWRGQVWEKDKQLAAKDAQIAELKKALEKVRSLMGRNKSAAVVGGFDKLAVDNENMRLYIDELVKKYKEQS